MSWFSKFNPAPAFPAYTGPYPVGTVDVEVPAADLPSPTAEPESAPATVAFRIFYPCEKITTAARPVRWIPQPQGATLSAFARFMGANSRFAEIFGRFPHLIYYITIPAQRNATLLEAPTLDKRWPVMFFSHGLAGSRNMYSHICGSLSAHGIIVIAMDHRDGSSPIQYVRATKDTEAKIIPSLKMSHTPSKEVYEGRDKQLRIRTWELALAHMAVTKIDRGETLENLDHNTSKSHAERVDILGMFKDVLDVHEPGRISWAGHSFGAVTTCQFVKSIFYNSSRPESATTPLISVDKDSALSKQITTSSPIALLDMWGLPFHSPAQSWVWNLPMPSYAPGGPGGKAIVSIQSQGFVNWAGNLNDVKRAIAPPENYTGPDPHMFYPVDSQHFSQSDFGILFPWITRRLLKAAEPERVLTLNVRAVLQMMRQNNIPVSETTIKEMEMDGKSTEKAPYQDYSIFDTDSKIRGWVPLYISDRTKNDKVSTTNDEKATPVAELSNGQRMEL